MELESTGVSPQPSQVEHKELSQPFLVCHMLWPNPLSGPQQCSLQSLCMGIQSQELRAGKSFSQPAVYTPAHTAQPTVCFCGKRLLLLNSSQLTVHYDHQIFSAKLFSAFLFVKLLGFLLAHINFLKFLWMAAPVIHYFHQFGITFDLLRVHSNLSFVPPMKMLNTGTSISPQGTSPITLCQFNAGTASFSTHCSLSNNPSWENSFGSRDANESQKTWYHQSKQGPLLLLCQHLSLSTTSSHSGKICPW